MSNFENEGNWGYKILIMDFVFQFAIQKFKDQDI